MAPNAVQVTIYDPENIFYKNPIFLVTPILHIVIFVIVDIVQIKRSLMQFIIDNASERPVYQQIIDQTKRDIALGNLQKQEKLPTVRQLSAQLAINPNTIAKAYRQLEKEGIINTRPGAGAFIANLDSTLSTAVRKKIITDLLERAVIDAFHMQIDKSTLEKWFNNAVERFNLPSKEGKSK